jgi:hypothetical protein
VSTQCCGGVQYSRVYSRDPPASKGSNCDTQVESSMMRCYTAQKLHWRRLHGVMALCCLSAFPGVKKGGAHRAARRRVASFLGVRLIRRSGGNGERKNSSRVFCQHHNALFRTPTASRTTTVTLIPLPYEILISLLSIHVFP